jgi:hypothetical protein
LIVGQTYLSCAINSTMKIEGAGFYEALIDVCKLHNVTVQNTVILIFTVVTASKSHVYVLIDLFNDAFSTSVVIWRRNVVRIIGYVRLT